MTQTPPPSAADLRAQLARSREKLYIIAAEIGQHPTRLGMALNERIPMSPDLAQRLQRALAEREERRSQ